MCIIIGDVHQFIGHCLIPDSKILLSAENATFESQYIVKTADPLLKTQKMQ